MGGWLEWIIKLISAEALLGLAELGKMKRNISDIKDHMKTEHNKIA